MNLLKKLVDKKKVLVAAHRGMCGGDIPCNSIPAFEIALSNGADILELDLFKTLDNEIFIFHTGKEPIYLDRHIDVTLKTSEEIRALRLFNSDFNETAFGLNTFDEILETFKGRCILNLDRCFEFLPEVLKYVERHNMREQILLKNAPTKQALKMVEEIASDYMFMPVFKDVDNESEMIDKMNISYVGAELVFSSEDVQIIQPQYLDKLKENGKLLWANSLVYSYKVPLSAGHNDNISMLGNPEAGWGWLIDRGFDIIQTDWTLQCSDYIKNR